MDNECISQCISVLLDRINNSHEHPEALFQGLKRNLQRANALLKVAEQNQVSAQIVKLWLPNFTEVLFQAEDLFDEISAEALRRRVEERGLFRNLMSSSRSFYRRIETEMENIVEGLEISMNSVGDIPKEFIRKPEPPREQPSSPNLPASGVIGREDDKQAVIDLLLSDDAIDNGKPGVISIVGMPGVGKTALAQAIYNDCRVTEHFDLKVWIFVGENFDVFHVTKAVLQELKKKLSRKRFLLVLDDFWAENDSEWKRFLVALTEGLEGSKIFLTTRSEIVPKVTQTVQSYKLELMTDEDCWELISRVAFENIPVGSIHPDLEDIGRRIAKLCQGLPLTAKAIACHLVSKRHPEEWYSVFQNFSNYTIGILPILKVSYDSLSSPLKRCFAFCSIFPKGYLFEREKLVLLWMATDLLYQPNSIKRLEDIGYEYLDELVARSFFQPSENSKRRSFVMHDLVSDLATSVSGDFCFRLEDNRNFQIPNKVLHFSFSGSQRDPSMIFESVCEAKLLRTFLPFDLPPNLQSFQLADRKLHDLVLALQRLQVLSLSHYPIINLPESFKGLKHLRYLDLSSTGINKLPQLVCTLYNLQTLLLSDCNSLKRLPIDITRLINLQYLDLEGTPLKEMPIGISRLRSLQKLSNFVMGRQSGAGLHELKELTHLRGTLQISELQNVAFSTEPKAAGLREKPFLDGLVLKWSVDYDSGYTPGKKNTVACDQKTVLEKLRPHPNLKTLCIESYGGASFPTWVGNPSFSNIVFIYLSSCSLCVSLPPLGQLLSLKDLFIKKLDTVQNIGHEFFYDDNDPPAVPFPSLQRLSFYSMQSWEEWSCPRIEAGVFPSLQKLIIDGCPKLTKELPEGLPLFTEVVISDCPLARVYGRGSSLSSAPSYITLSSKYSSSRGREYATASSTSSDDNNDAISEEP